MAHSFQKELQTLIAARYPVVHIRTSEEERFEHMLRALSGRMKCDYWSWSITRGLNGPPNTPDYSNKTDPIEAVHMSLDLDAPAVIVFRDLFECLPDIKLARAIADAVRELPHKRKTIFITSHGLDVPNNLRKLVITRDFPLPTFPELRELVDSVIESVSSKKSVTVSLEDEEKDALANAALGLTEREAENALARAVVLDRRLDIEDVNVIIREKRELLENASGIEYFEPQLTMSDVGGLANLKQWLSDRKRGFSQAAKEYGLAPPKGLLLIGVPGCGKSLSAKCASGQWKMPLLKLDIGRLMDKFVGGSEGNLHRALTSAAAISPCILWIDELEKAFAGVGSDSSGVTTRLLGSLLSWMQDRPAPVFIFATANDVSLLPPELLRKGRFDEIFFVDLPNESSREEIFKIHLARRKRDAAAFDLEKLVQATEGFTGAELEMVVVDGLYTSFSAQRELAQDDMLKVCNDMVPLSSTMKEKIGDLRKWAGKRARSADLLQ